ncbi:MAG: nucleotidyltransferase domain-containing protein [Candidatus Hydrogenedentota bacterium]
MADPAIMAIVRQYLALLPQFGIHPERAILFGSHLRGDTHECNDIDLVVIAPGFDISRGMATKQKLWAARIKSGERIEPIPCGVKEWKNVAHTTRPIIDIALREGKIIKPALAA